MNSEGTKFADGTKLLREVKEGAAMVYWERSYNAGNNGQKNDMKFSADRCTQEK